MLTWEMRPVGPMPAATSDRSILRFFAVANVPHENFYESDMVAQDMADSLDYAETLMDKLLPMLTQT